MINSIILFIACTQTVKLRVIKKKKVCIYLTIERTTIHSYDTRRSATNEYYIAVAYTHDLKIVVSISQNITVAAIILAYTYKHIISYAID